MKVLQRVLKIDSLMLRKSFSVRGGFKGTSVRAIAASANCNVGAVNYYSGGKEKLYKEVWRRNLISLRGARIASIEKVMSQNNGQYRLEDLLWYSANAFVGPLAEARQMSRLIKLMTRECMERHLPVSMFADNVIRPTMAVMGKTLVRIYPDLEQSAIPLQTFSLIGQLAHVVHMRAIFEQDNEDLDLPIFDLGKAIYHIVKFSADGIRAYTEGKMK